MTLRLTVALLIGPVLVVLLVPTASAQSIYKCREPGGGTQFSDKPCEGGTLIMRGPVPQERPSARGSRAEAVPPPSDRGATLDLGGGESIGIESGSALFNCGDPAHAHRRQKIAFTLEGLPGGTRTLCAEDPEPPAPPADRTTPPPPTKVPPGKPARKAAEPVERDNRTRRQ